MPKSFGPGMGHYSHIEQSFPYAGLECMPAAGLARWFSRGSKDSHFEKMGLVGIGPRC